MDPPPLPEPQHVKLSDTSKTFSQDVSTVNPTRPGLRNGWQTGLCSHIFRLLRNHRVPWVVLENVPGLLMWHLSEDQPQEPAISYVVEELENLGYCWAHRVISLTGFGLPQCRRRVFIVASLHGDPRDVLLSTESACKGQCIDMNLGENETGTPQECYSCFQTPPHRQPRQTIACVDLAEKRFGPSIHEIHTLTTSNGRRTCLVEDLGSGKGNAFGLHIEDAERMSGFPVGWTEPCTPLKIPGHAGLCSLTTAAHVNKRFELLGLAVSIPQARWIGERLRRPYELKFARSLHGTLFSTPVPGGDLVDRNDRDSVNAWPKVAWNMNDIDDASPKQRWKSRYALDGCKESPVISPFSPLGELDLYRHVCVDADAAKGYLQRAADNDIAIPEFVQDGLRRLGGERVRRNTSDKIEKQTEPVNEVYAGEIVWIPTKVGKQSCYWPGIALNLDRDRGLIPDVGMKVRKADQTAETHRFAIYFGDKTFEWVKADTLLDFFANAERLKIIQKSMLSRTKYMKALDIAFERLDKQMSTTDHARRKMYEHNKHIAENRLKERLGSLHDTPPTTCGKCNVCLSRSREREELPFSKRHLPRASAKPTNKPALKGVKCVDVCPQLQVCISSPRASECV